MRLDEYFKLHHFEDALNSFVKAKPHWPVKDRYEMYKLAMIAFESNAEPSIKRKATVALYNRLIDYWGILRPFSREECWDGNRVFEVVSSECDAVSRSSGIDLINFDGTHLFSTVLRCVSKFGRTKPMTNDFPHMPMAKLLHFFNPSLFPIYDREEVWNKVCRGAFKADYDRFCRQHGFKVWEASAKFNVYYTWWASDVLRTADDGIGDVFSRWFAEQVGAESGDFIIGECDRYWGAMFEIAAIGAAHL